MTLIFHRMVALTSLINKLADCSPNYPKTIRMFSQIFCTLSFNKRTSNEETHSKSGSNTHPPPSGGGWNQTFLKIWRDCQLVLWILTNTKSTIQMNNMRMNPNVGWKNEKTRHSNGRSLPCRSSCNIKFQFVVSVCTKSRIVALFLCPHFTSIRAVINYRYSNVYLGEPNACGAKTATHCYYFGFTLLVLITET